MCPPTFFLTFQVQVDRDLEVVDDLGVNLLVTANTHAHADHITGSGKIKVWLGSWGEGGGVTLLPLPVAATRMHTLTT